MHANSTPSHPALASVSNNATDTITPVNTPPETRISVFPSDRVLGERVNYDPMLDGKLDKRAKQSLKPKYTQILDKVCEGCT